MHIRPAESKDLDRIGDIDGTIESSDYLHLERSGEGLSQTWKLERRSLREKLIASNPISDELRFAIRQIVTGADDGLVLIAEHDELPVGLVVAQPRPLEGTIQLLDLRVDSDLRRQGVATVLGFQVIQHARDREIRAVSAETRTNNLPANQLLQKLSFEMAGVDTHRYSNHDMVKESATILWYAALD